MKALRLIPENEEKALGRTGLLAHSFMLGPNGQSNGCVSFRDYDAFLHAYLDHRVKRLIVVQPLIKLASAEEPRAGPAAILRSSQITRHYFRFFASRTATR